MRNLLFSIKSLFLSGLSLFLMGSFYPLYGQNKPFGLGFSLGDVTGVTLNYKLSPDQALRLGLGLNALDGGKEVGHFAADFLQTWANLKPDIYSYYGGGITLMSGVYNNAVGLGVRLPVGLKFLINSWEIFGELIPTLFTGSSILRLRLEAALGFHYFF